MAIDPPYREPDFQRLRDVEAARRAAQEAERRDTMRAVREMKSPWLGLTRSVADWNAREKELVLSMPRGEYEVRQGVIFMFLFGCALVLGIFFAACLGG